jgi:triacylglycerol lipase
VAGAATVAYAAHREGGAGADALTGGGRADALFGLAGNDRLSGGNGDDLLVGGAGRDRLTGGNGADRLFGGAGDDLFVGGAGDDTMSGGFGSDLFDFRAGLAGDDVVTDFDMGEEGDDRLRFSRVDFASFAEVVAHAREDGDALVIEGENGSVRLMGLQLVDLTAADVIFG